MKNIALENYSKEHEMIAQAIKFEAPGDRRAALERIVDNIHRLIMQATAMQDDGRDISKKLDQIENEFTKLSTI